MTIKRFAPQILTIFWRFLRLLVASAILALVGFGLVCALIVLQGQRDDVGVTVESADALLVMGAAQWDGRPSPVLEARLNHAAELYHRGIAPRIILPGGVAPGDTLSEAAVSKDYLTSLGVPEQALLIEEMSRTSWQNLRMSAEIARTHDIDSIIIVSDDFHMLRSLKMARDLGFTAYGSPARSSPIANNPRTELAYVVREAGAYSIYIFFQR